MNRDHALHALGDRKEPWDVVVIGGGATGLGAAVDAASRGYSTLLLEQHDFSKGTSSRSTKLIHGGVRYLAQGNWRLVRDALHERALLRNNAPHVVHDLEFVVPGYSWWELPYYFAGLKLYDLLGGHAGHERSRWLPRDDVCRRIPGLVQRGLRGGILYRDCQFDDARMAVALARTLFDLGGVALNYARVGGLLKNANRLHGVRVCDVETGGEYDVHSRVVVNATGVFVDRLCRMDDATARPVVTPSRGIHIVLDRSVLRGDCAIVVPRTDDRRVLFAIPWHDKVLVGTTDTPVAEPELEPRPVEQDVDFLLEHAGRYLADRPQRADVLSMFAGLRPLVRAKTGQRTAAVSREHHIEVSSSGLVTIAGGKWTAYRRMGADVIDEAARVGGLPERESNTPALRLHGWCTDIDPQHFLSVYGSDAEAIQGLAATSANWGEKIHARLPYLKAEVIWAVRNEMARTVEDVLARRTRALFLDARASIESAPAVAALMAAELGRPPAWVQPQLADYAALASGYVPG